MPTASSEGSAPQREGPRVSGALNAGADAGQSDPETRSPQPETAPPHHIREAVRRGRYWGADYAFALRAIQRGLVRRDVPDSFADGGLRPSDPTIMALAARTDVNDRIVSIYPSFDPHIPAGSELEGAVNVPVRAMGHFRILEDAEVLDAVEGAVAGRPNLSSEE